MVDTPVAQVSKRLFLVFTPARIDVEVGLVPQVNHGLFSTAEMAMKSMSEDSANRKFEKLLVTSDPSHASRARKGKKQAVKA